MEFSKYIWSIYKQSSQGKRAIAKYQKLKSNYYKLYKSSLVFPVDNIDEMECQKFVRAVQNEFGKALNNPDKEAYKYFSKYKNNDYLHVIDLMSLGFYFTHPKFFVPYFWRLRFDSFKEICESFDIQLPPLPKINDNVARYHYYLDINKVLLDFALRYDMSIPELCAFMYEFAPNHISANDSRAEMPLPTTARILVGNSVAGDTSLLDSCRHNIGAWGCPPTTRRGDVILMYEPSPVKGIRAIYRANSDACYDPFGYWPAYVRLNKPQIIKTVPLEAMRNDPTLGAHPSFKHAILFKPPRKLTLEEYDAFVGIAVKQGNKSSIFPKINKTYSISKNIIIDREEDVEKYLINPLLRKLGYAPTDWKTQFPIKMGRTHVYFPDYAFGAKGKEGAETARMILEAKYSLSTAKQESSALSQALSYANRLRASTVVLASIEGISIFMEKGGRFHNSPALKTTWQQLGQPSMFSKCTKLIGKAYAKS